MLRVPFLRNLLLLVVAVTVCMPLYTTLVLHPAYHRQLVLNTEEESVRFANYLLRTVGLDGVRLQREKLPAHTVTQVALLQQDRHLLKLRFFSAEGVIIFSTDSTEIGTQNTNDYFRNIVAKGQVYSKVVEKDHQTADGVLTKIDVVETYVPFLADGYFSGAIEVYYDITKRVATINGLTLRTTMIVAAFAGIFLTAILLALHKAKVALGERQTAEDALRQANELLEARVTARTAELSTANAQLTAEIAERTQAQIALSQALEESRRDREQLDGILSSVMDGVVMADGDLKVLHMNDAAEHLLEVSLNKVLGQPLEQLAGTALFPARVRKQLSEDPAEQTFDFERPGKDPKQPLIYQVRISRVDSDLEKPGVVLMIQDVTRERQLERLKNAFLGMAAHELNTPLASILGFSELLIMPDTAGQLTPAQQAESLAAIHGKALELSRLIDDLLDISRIEAGQPLVLDYEAVQLDKLVHDVLRTYQEQSSRHRFELHLGLSEMTIQVDAGRIRQVLNNLLSNAVKYSPKGGKILVSLAEDDGRCLLSVADEGIGMTAEQVEHVFDRFYRADASNTAVKGVGLGMSIVRHIVLAHGGDIRVESRLGSGTTVHVVLPTAAPQAMADS